MVQKGLKLSANRVSEGSQTKFKTVMKLNVSSMSLNFS